MAVKNYEIVLKNCAFFARHGVFEEEKRIGQRFFVDARLQVHVPVSLDNADYKDVVDYGAIFSHIEMIVIKENFDLIEALAARIARSLRETFAQIDEAIITVRKPGAPIPGVLDYVEVTVRD